MIPLSVPQLEAAASDIAVTTCVARESMWSGRKIVTVYTLEVGESVKGAATGTITLTLPGGSVEKPDPVTMHVPGVPRLKPKSQALLFMQKTQGGSRTVVGWQQGCFPVEHDAEGRAWVHAPAPTSAKPRAKAVLDAAGQRVALSAFLAEIAEVKRQREAAHD